ncbi:endochitinase [Colletotrichum orchidophilum]|uniref:chitinase n=1 Tax=Colletotrichum orchidophilum TaxID=1209926 RepID=A0A1G4B5S7_9PEZI|nr:endochitinase [Colletotrichum orchidophilum]OHE96642.1 endochitinase [Colletotrichum orchidophilum]
MLFSKSFLAAAAAISPTLAHSSSQTTTNASPLLGLNLYWGQYGQPTDRLSSYCDAPGVTSVSLSFVTYSPKNSAGYPGTNFAGHCGGEVYYKNPKTGEDTKLIMNCDYIKKDIQYCQAKGVKILLAIGGYCPTGGPCSYDIDSEQDGHDFGDLLHKTFGPYDQGWNGPRPFDISETEHIAVDGFDFDLEFKYPDQKPWIKMVETLRSCGIYHISAAPQCPTSDTWFQLKELIYNAKFDSLFIQFYNNPGCEVTDTPNYDDWETVISQTSKSQDAKLYIGVLASADSGWSGYAPPSAIKELICKYQSKPHFGGVSIWDATRGAINQIDGQSFQEAIADGLKYGCNPIPAKTSTISVSTSTSSLISSASTSAAVASTTSTSSSSSFSSVSLSYSHSASASVSASASASASASVSASASESASESPSASPSASASSSASVSISASASSSASASASFTFFGNSSVSATGSASISSASVSGSLTQSSIIATLSANATASASASATKSATASDTCDEDDEDFPTSTMENSHTITATATATATATGTSTGSANGSADATKTASGSVTDKATGSATGSATEPAKNSLTLSISDVPTGTKSPSESAKNTLSAPEELTTSTVFTTKITTVTSCKPDVPCTKGQVVTETIPWYTTVCPITAASSAVAVPTISPPPQWVTSTVFTTKTYTITSCAPDVLNCPVGHVTTVVVPAYTTVCPYTGITSGSTKPSGGLPNPPKPSGDVPQPPQSTGDVAKPTGSQGGNKPSGDIPQPPKPTGDAPKPIGSQGGSQPPGDISAPPKPTASSVVPGGDKCPGGKNCPVKEDDSTTFIYKTLTIPVTVGRYNSTLAGTGFNYAPTSTGGLPSYTTAAAVPSKPVQAGAAKIVAFGVGSFAALAAALLL